MKRFLRAADFREHARRFRVQRERFLLVRLATIDIRLRRRVDQRIEIQPAQRRPHLLRRAEIELRMIESDHVRGVARIRASARESSACTDRNYSPARVHATGLKGIGNVKKSGAPQFKRRFSRSALRGKPTPLRRR